MDSKADKLMKKTIKEQQKRIKPGECLKYIRIVLDNRIQKMHFGLELINELNSAQLQYEFRTLPLTHCIFWERSVYQRTIVPVNSQDNAIALDDEWQMEKQVVQIIMGRDMQTAIRNSSVQTFGEEFHKVFPEKRYTIVILQTKDEIPTSTSHVMTTTQALVDLQMFHQVNTWKVEPSAQEVMAFLRRFTKSIAEIPYKEQKNVNLNCFKKFLANDKKQCVRVEGQNGLRRLWQQHLTRIPLVTLEVAETIIAKYSCPRKLLDEYKYNENAIREIADLKINRSGRVEPLQTAERRIGEVLSRKLYTIYTTIDPNTIL